MSHCHSRDSRDSQVQHCARETTRKAIFHELAYSISFDTFSIPFVQFIVVCPRSTEVYSQIGPSRGVRPLVIQLNLVLAYWFVLQKIGEKKMELTEAGIRSIKVSLQLRKAPISISAPLAVHQSSSKRQTNQSDKLTQCISNSQERRNKAKDQNCTTLFNF